MAASGVEVHDDSEVDDRVACRGVPLSLRGGREEVHGRVKNEHSTKRRGKERAVSYTRINNQPELHRKGHLRLLRG